MTAQLEDNPLDEIGMVPHCASCGSERVAKDAWACWNSEAGHWELERAFDDAHCHRCEGKTTLEWTRPDQPSPKAIRELNDRLRVYGQGNGKLILTPGMTAKGQPFLDSAIDAMRRFDSFTDENDRHGEHDFGSLDVEDEKVFWKIDYYDLALKLHSSNAANEGVTCRVLTVMLADEY